MTVSMRVMSAGTGYRYLLKSVVVADGDRALSTPLVDYYAAQSGTPQGRWLGSGVADLGDGALTAGDMVTEVQLQRLLGAGRDPLTDVPLGHSFPTFKPETGRRAVAGFDVTFSAPKSVSVLWALADPTIRKAVEAAHHAAIADVVGLMERQVAATRTGIATPDGAVAQVAVTGLIATAYDHWDSRAGDPQLHTHVVIANKAKTVLDGVWRSLDGLPLHAAMVALSEHYNAVLADQLTARLGVGWQPRVRGTDRNAGWEIAGIPNQLLETFSARSTAIEVEKDRLIAQYRTEHGHLPSSTTIIRLRQQATLATRPDKTVQPLTHLLKGWQSRAADILNQNPQDWAAGLTGRSGSEPITTDLIPDSVVERLAGQVVAVVGERRSTWRYWNLHAEASRQTIGLRFATTTDRERLLDRIVQTAQDRSVRLTPPDLAPSPPEFRRADGTSVFRPAHSDVFTSTDLLAAEDRLLNLARTATGPDVPVRNLTHATHLPDGRVLADDQAAAILTVGTSRRTVDVLIGPAGAGKTTTMAALRSAWELSHGAGSVVGLAPSAAAAAVLAADLGIGTENTAKWLHDHAAGKTRLQPGQLVIVDEASLAGTLALDRIATHAGQVGAKVLLVGDAAQLGAVQAGGAFGMLARDITDPAELVGIHRFTQPWEADASRKLRNGDLDVVDTYTRHDRIDGGNTADMLNRLFEGWRADIERGKASLMIGHTHDTVTQLNQRARADRIAAGQVDPTVAVRLHDQTVASSGDQILTRRNNRHLSAGTGWVKNGDRWSIVGVHADGALDVRRTGHGSAVRLPADYVAAHVELGYAVTVHRAQGATVDTAHTLASTGMTREAFNVAMTRGRTTNTAYVPTDQPDTEPHQHQPSPQTATSVLTGILRHSGVERSAHDATRAEQDRWSSLAQLVAEYDTLAAAAQHQRWVDLIGRSGLRANQADSVITSEAFGPLTAQLRLAEAAHYNPDQLLPRLVAARPLDDTDDPAAVLHHRLVNATRRRNFNNRSRPAPRLIVGLVTEATGPMEPSMRRALDQRAVLMEQRVDALLDSAIARSEPWLDNIGRPRGPRDLTRWRGQLRTVVAYRDRYGMTDPSTVLGPEPGSDVQRRDQARARAAIRQQTSAVLARQASDHALEVGRRQPDRPTRGI